MTGKRKRDADEEDLSNGDVGAKRVHSSTANGDDGTQPIVLDEADEGAILIDDWTTNVGERVTCLFSSYLTIFSFLTMSFLFSLTVKYLSRWVVWCKTKWIFCDYLRIDRKWMFMLLGIMSSAVYIYMREVAQYPSQKRCTIHHSTRHPGSRCNYSHTHSAPETPLHLRFLAAFQIDQVVFSLLVDLSRFD